MEFKRSNRQKVVTYLVASGNQAVAPANPLFGTSTAMNIANGQIGILTETNALLTPASAVPATTEIRLVQGTPASSNILTADNVFHAGHRTHVDSAPIQASRVRSVAKQLPTPGTRSSELVRVATVDSFANYGFHIRVNSRRNDRDFGFNNDVTYRSFETPDYTANSFTSNVDHMLQNLLFRVNMSSKLVSGTSNFIALAIDVAPATAGNGVDLGTIAPGDVIPVVAYNGTTYNLVADLTLINTLAEAISNTALTNASEIMLIDPSTAGAGSADAFLVIGLDSDLAVAYDDIEQVRNRVEVITADSFVLDGVESVIATHAEEEKGQGRKLWIDYMERARMSLGTPQILPMNEFFVEPKYYFDKDAWYTTVVIDYYDYTNELMTATPHEKSIVVCLPSTVTATNVAGGVTATITASTTRTNLNTALATFLASGNPEYLGAATAAAPF